MGKSTTKINKSAGQRLEREDEQTLFRQGLQQKAQGRPNED